MRFSILLALVLPCTAFACSAGGDVTGDAGVADSTTIVDVNDEEPLICTEFTAEAGAACPTPSPIACFACGDGGGCYCRQTPSGPRWTCVIDPGCLPCSGEDNCAPDFDAQVDMDATLQDGTAATDSGHAD